MNYEIIEPIDSKGNAVFQGVVSLPPKSSTCDLLFKEAFKVPMVRPIFDKECFFDEEYVSLIQKILEKKKEVFSKVILIEVEFLDIQDLDFKINYEGDSVESVIQPFLNSIQLGEWKFSLNNEEKISLIKQIKYLEGFCGIRLGLSLRIFDNSFKVQELFEELLILTQLRLSGKI